MVKRMRRFNSYGPVDPSEHFFAPRAELVDRVVQGLVGKQGKQGHYFTIWAPRQTGKTWLMRRAMEEIRQKHGDRFIVGSLTLQGTMGEKDTEEVFFRAVPGLFKHGFSLDIPAPAGWAGWESLFDKGGLFDRPLILLIDEVDSLPPVVLDRIVAVFRKIFLEPEAHILHGLALVGVHAVLGLDSPRGSPFNIQRSLHVPNLSREEVIDMFDQYRAESGQTVEERVPELVYETTRGQPGLVGWIGELLTEKFNEDPTRPISETTFNVAYQAACHTEWNNTVLNLIAKARGPHRDHVIALFTDPNIPFTLRMPWCSYLYTNGIIDFWQPPGADAGGGAVCRFSSPFVQLNLYAALTADMFGEKGPLLAIEPGDRLSDVFTADALCLAPLLSRYKGYLKRLEVQGINPWRDQPRRKDTHLAEAVGHFHLYAWLLQAIGRRTTISPEFPTGNGKVDLVVRTREGRTAVIEVKSFIDMYELDRSREQAAGYAKKLGLPVATLAVFVPVKDDALLESLSGAAVVDGIDVVTVAIGWT